MLESMLGETGGAVAQFILALIFVVVLIILVAWIIKKIGGGRFGASQSGKADLEIVDAIVVDQKRRLVLVRHGKLEHLLLIGGGSDEVVERSMIGGVPIAARLEAQRIAGRGASGGTPPEPAIETQPEAEEAPTPEPVAEPEQVEASDTSMGRGAAAAAVTGLAAATATSGIAAAVSKTLTPPPPVAPLLEAASEPAPSAAPAQAEVSAETFDLEASLERALTEPFESKPSFGGSAEAPTPEPAIEAAPEFDLASELEAALSEQRGDPPAEPKAEPTVAIAEAPIAVKPVEPAPEELELAEPAPEPEAPEPPAPPSSSTIDEVNFAVRPDPVSVTIPSRGPAAGAVTVNQAADVAADDMTDPQPAPVAETPVPTEPEEAPAPAEPAATQEADAPESAMEPAPVATTASNEPLIDLGDLALPSEPPAAESETTSDDLDEEMRRLLGEIAGAPPKRD